MKDVLGAVLWDYWHGELEPPLLVRYEDGTTDEMLPAVYFRSSGELPELERKALRHCRGKVLEIGAGAGSHALLLQERGLDVTALDISPKAVAVMQLRGVRQTVCTDIYQYTGGPFDTLLLLMNGIGLTGNLTGLHLFLRHAATLLQPDGQLLFDSSDVSYLYEEHPPPMDPYYGVVRYRYDYNGAQTDWNTWLYIDRHTLAAVALSEGWQTTILYDDGDDQYLARLKRVD